MRCGAATVEAKTMVSELKSTNIRFDLREYMPLVAHAVTEKAVMLVGDARHGQLACAGMIGLLEATVTFPSSEDSSFGVFALRRIRHAVGEELSGVPWSQRSAMQSAVVTGHVRRVLPQGLTAAPSPAEAATCLRLRVQDVRRLIIDVAGSSPNWEQMLLGTHTDHREPSPASPLNATRHAGYYADVAAAAAPRTQDSFVAPAEELRAAQPGA